MRLLSFAFKDALGPVKEGFLPLGELTAVIGANDAGKTRLMSTFAEALAAESDPGDVQATFYVEIELAELSELFGAMERWHDSVERALRREDIIARVHGITDRAAALIDRQF